MKKFLCTPFFVIFLIGCAGNPIEEAKTLEQKSYAAYGVFVATQAEARKIIEDPDVNDVVKLGIQKSVSIAHPAADLIPPAARAVRHAREELEDVRDETTVDKFKAAVNALNAIYEEVIGKITKFVDAVENL